MEEPVDGDGPFVVLGHVDAVQGYVGYAEGAQGGDETAFLAALRRGLQNEEVMLLLDRALYETDVAGSFQGREGVWAQFWRDLPRQRVILDGAPLCGPPAAVLRRLAATVAACRADRLKAAARQGGLFAARTNAPLNRPEATWGGWLGQLAALAMFTNMDASTAGHDEPQCVMRDAVAGTPQNSPQNSPSRRREVLPEGADAAHVDKLALFCQQGALGPVYELLTKEYAQFEHNVHVSDDGQEDATEIVRVADDADMPDLAVRTRRSFRVVQLDDGRGLGAANIGIVGIELECLLFSEQRVVLKLLGRHQPLG
eukprot:TRINITY_DN15839_c0_g1_i1.p1 TRINITY_DN15839_c0_g1~~TRINITY_DN15839_c0_g1_i1.p1  ORF type:complete len:313 (+),score=92.62 TRINITY_DN15839_c0_g1_i1:89-1027(+)